MESLEIRIKLRPTRLTDQKISKLRATKKAEKSTDNSKGVRDKKETIVSAVVTKLKPPAPNRVKKADDNDNSLRLYIKVDQTTNIVSAMENLQTIESLTELTLKKGSLDITRQPKREFLQKISMEFLKNS